MNAGKVLSWVVIGLCFAASVGYLWSKDYRHAAYRFFCGCLFVSVTI